MNLLYASPPQERSGRREPARARRGGTSRPPHSKTGVALVITLIMLSVITVVIVAFLALAMRDRSAAATTEKLTRAQLMSDAARDRAIAEIGRQMLMGYNENLGATSLMTFDFMVSKTNPQDVAWISQVTNVFVPINNRSKNGPWVTADTNLSFLDLNRNGWYEFDTNLPSTGPGDPEWIGVPEMPLGPTGLLTDKNRLVGRYAFLVQPAGKSLDLNFIHNQAKQPQLSPANPTYEGFLRANSVGSWELNLASFLVDLNTNVWFPPADYEYVPNVSALSRGTAFWDAFNLLQFRYDTNFISLADGPTALAGLGEYTNRWAGSDNQRHYYDCSELYITNSTYSNFVARFTSVQSDPPDPANIDPVNDYNRQTFYRLLSQLGMDSVPERPKMNLNFMNLEPQFNPQNVITNWVPTNLVETGYYDAWTNDPTLFFNQVAGRLLQDMKQEHWVGRIRNADKILAAGDSNGIPGWPRNQFRIPVWPRTNNCYTPAVHRLMQLAANLYDATQDGAVPTGQTGPSPQYSRYFPTVFRPILERDNNNTLVLVRYEAVTNHQALTNQIATAALWHDPNDASFVIPNSPNTQFFYGIPLIVGAKKGFPNFNEVTMDTEMVLTRKVSLFKAAPGLTPNRTNQFYTLSIANRLGFEAWNSYDLPYPNEVVLFAAFRMTNALISKGLSVMNSANASVTNIVVPANAFGPRTRTSSYRVAAFTNMLFMPSLEYRFDPSPRFTPLAGTEGEPDVSRAPDWNIEITNRFIFYIYDRRANRLLDVVSLSGLSHATNIMTAILAASASAEDQELLSLWDTNVLFSAAGPMTAGVSNQMRISLDPSQQNQRLWTDYAGTTMRNDLVTGLRKFVTATTNGQPDPQTTYAVGFNPSVRVYLTSTWQANDPLVHSMEWDLVEATNHFESVVASYRSPKIFGSDYNLGQRNSAYRPWYSDQELGSEKYPFDLAIQDPMVRSSEDWDFPEGKLPSVGWVGRVHRGTPWQTVYMKAEGASEAEWRQQTPGPYYFGINQGTTTGATNIPAALLFTWWPTHPTNDWRLVDLFTAAPNANATRGALSINQENQAAWSAVLGGMMILSNVPSMVGNSDPNFYARLMNLDPNVHSNVVIWPASTNLERIVAGINEYRSLRPSQVFHRLSEVLAVPEFSVDRNAVTRGINGRAPRCSPFLFLRAIDPTADEQQKFRITDAAYEALPMQVLSLLRVGEPRVVIYAYGQAIEPYGPEYVNANGPTNYRVTAEHATRSVVRFDLQRTETGTNVYISLRPVIESYRILPPD